jgi:hypothetical protein
MATVPAPTDRRQVGVITSVAPNSSGGVAYAPLNIDGARDQRVVNDTALPMHIMFADQSAMTLGPNSTLVIKRFQYDSQTKQGGIAVELVRGLLRVVGGQLSKRAPTMVATSTATIGIRGGISIIEVKDNGDTTSSFLFGESMEVKSGADRIASLGGPGLEEQGGTVLASNQSLTSEEADSGQATFNAATGTINVTVPGYSVQVFATAPMFLQRLTPAQITTLLNSINTQIDAIVQSGGRGDLEGRVGGNENNSGARASVSLTKNPSPPPPPPSPTSGPAGSPPSVNSLTGGSGDTNRYRS